MGRWVREGHDIEVLMPRAPYPLRMLETVGFADAIATFATVNRSGEPAEKVRRYHPIIRARNFKALDDVRRDRQ